MTDNSWRSDGWENPWKYTDTDGTVLFHEAYAETFEKGATAMLEALRKAAVKIPPDARILVIIHGDFRQTSIELVGENWGTSLSPWRWASAV